ncbi:MAG: hypothetical protein JWO82_2962 [Akkermansiaceae bacterium]|nr:hypothetical protein [Akkermansiaceae bacterium]
MNVIRSNLLLAWGELDLPLFGVGRDWAGVACDPPAAFCLAVDPQRLWFIASHARSARLHPAARPGKFTADLWQYDVAELFLSHPGTGRYLEFNLAPNGAWWSCEFTAPRKRAEEADIAFPEVATYAELSPDGGWVAAMAIPLALLQARLDFGPGTRGNVTFILGSPAQRFLTAAKLGDGDPDFHRPGHFPELVFNEAS